jgi:signal transduction histidine kinase
MKAAYSVSVAGSQTAWDFDSFGECAIPERIVPESGRDAERTHHEPAVDPGFSRRRREADDSVLDYPALLMQERETHSKNLADRDRLLAIFSHDLRNLLNALTLNEAIVLQRKGNSEKAASNVQFIIGRMDRMLSNLLDLARVNAGKLSVVAESRDAAQVVRETVDAFRLLAEARHLTLYLSETGGPFDARIDDDRISQVLSNLLSNAIKFSCPEGDIFVSLSTTDDFVQVAVQDFGLGIPETDFERIFECYRQLDGSDATGLGLGLFISKSIVQAHGGKIWLESKLGAGSTFLFTVPGIKATSAA